MSCENKEPNGLAKANPEQAVDDECGPRKLRTQFGSCLEVDQPKALQLGAL